MITSPPVLWNAKLITPIRMLDSAPLRSLVAFSESELSKPPP
jgi:hypothetical protein